MGKSVSLRSLFGALEYSETVYELVNESVLVGMSEFFICPANQVPDDGRSYLSFVGWSAKNPSELLCSTRADLLIVDRSIDISHKTNACLIRVDNARLFMCELLAYDQCTRPAFISSMAIVDETAVVGVNTSVGHFSSIGKGVVIGESCVISNNVTILDDVMIGDRVIIGPGCVIGTDGFGFEKRADGSYIKFPHVGSVIIGDDVEMGGNVVIDRGTLGDTIIGSGVKFDNLVHVGHNVRIGNDTLITANAMFAGSSSIGQGSWVGPSSNILDKVVVGNNSFVGIGVSVIRNIPDRGRFTLKNFLKLFS